MCCRWFILVFLPTSEFKSDFLELLRRRFGKYPSPTCPNPDSYKTAAAFSITCSLFIIEARPFNCVFI